MARNSERWAYREVPEVDVRPTQVSSEIGVNCSRKSDAMSNRADALAGVRGGQVFVMRIVHKRRQPSTARHLDIGYEKSTHRDPRYAGWAFKGGSADVIRAFVGTIRGPFTAVIGSD